MNKTNKSSKYRSGNSSLLLGSINFAYLKYSFDVLCWHKSIYGLYCPRGNNICERNYVKIDTKSGRKLIPTELGKSMIYGLKQIDPELVEP